MNLTDLIHEICACACSCWGMNESTKTGMGKPNLGFKVSQNWLWASTQIFSGPIRDNIAKGVSHAFVLFHRVSRKYRWDTSLWESSNKGEGVSHPSDNHVDLQWWSITIIMIFLAQNCWLNDLYNSSFERPIVKASVLQILLFCENIFLKMSLKTFLLCGLFLIASSLGFLLEISLFLVQRHCCDNIFCERLLAILSGPLACANLVCKPSCVQLFANLLSKTYKLHVREHLLQGSSCAQLLFERPIFSGLCLWRTCLACFETLPFLNKLQERTLQTLKIFRASGVFGRSSAGSKVEDFRERASFCFFFERERELRKHG